VDQDDGRAVRRGPRGQTHGAGERRKVSVAGKQAMLGPGSLSTSSESSSRARPPGSWLTEDKVDSLATEPLIPCLCPSGEARREGLPIDWVPHVCDNSPSGCVFLPWRPGQPARTLSLSTPAHQAQAPPFVPGILPGSLFGLL
jgi:hypothetical protein